MLKNITKSVVLNERERVIFSMYKGIFLMDSSCENICNLNDAL